MNAVAKHLADGLDVRTATRVASLAHDDRSWHVVLDDGGRLDADAVVVTAPVPQALDLLAAGGVVLSPGDADALSRISLRPVPRPDGRRSTAPPGWTGPGAVDPADGPIDWMADNQLKGVSDDTGGDHPRHGRVQPGRTGSPTTGWSSTSCWPPPGWRLHRRPGEVQVQRWRYARPSVAHPEPCLLAAHLPTLVFAGDAFGGAKVEGAALSGAAAAAAVLGSGRS